MASPCLPKPKREPRPPRPPTRPPAWPQCDWNLLWSQMGSNMIRYDLYKLIYHHLTVMVWSVVAKWKRTSNPGVCLLQMARRKQDGTCVGQMGGKFIWMSGFGWMKIIKCQKALILAVGLCWPECKLVLQLCVFMHMDVVWCIQYDDKSYYMINMAKRGTNIQIFRDENNRTHSKALYLGFNQNDTQGWKKGRRKPQELKVKWEANAHSCYWLLSSWDLSMLPRTRQQYCNKMK